MWKFLKFAASPPPNLQQLTKEVASLAQEVERLAQEVTQQRLLVETLVSLVGRMSSVQLTPAVPQLEPPPISPPGPGNGAGTVFYFDPTRRNLTTTHDEWAEYLKARGLVSNTYEELPPPPPGVEL